MSNALPEPDRSRLTQTAIPLLFPIGHIPFFSGLLGLVPCALAFSRSGVHSHQTLGALLSRSLRPLNHLCSVFRPARRTGRNKPTSSFPIPNTCSQSHLITLDLIGVNLITCTYLLLVLVLCLLLPYIHYPTSILFPLSDSLSSSPLLTLYHLTLNCLLSYPRYILCSSPYI